MYNGIGLQTPRGSGTTGHIQSNKFSVAKSTNKVNVKIDAAVAERIEPRGATNKEILEHERKRQIELKLVVLEDKLMDHGYSDDEIAKKLDEARRNLESGATGQPKGSAYVEFKRKEAADHALSLDGTSFMLRILKVARKSASPQEAAPVMNWPRISRGSIFAASRFRRVPFPRGMPGLYRARVPIKVGARSFQWKRDAQTSPTEITGVSNNSVPSPTTPRSLTYVRPEPMANGNSGTV